VPDLKVCARDAIKDKSETYEQNARQAREQLAEMARTATEYSNMIQKKEDEIARREIEVASLKRDREHSLKEIAELQGDIDTLHGELEAQKHDQERGATIRAKLQEELDELRLLMEAKTSEATQKSEAEKSKDEELADLRRQVSKLQQELSEARKQALEGHSKLKVELDHLTREYTSLERDHALLAERERATMARLSTTQTSLSDLEKVKRSFDSELLSLRSRQNALESELAESVRAKEVGPALLNSCERFTETILGLGTSTCQCENKMWRL
jgi:myosin heavy chain 9/10/11/14